MTAFQDSDVVDQLRWLSWYARSDKADQAMKAAADEIERLRRELALRPKVKIDYRSLDLLTNIKGSSAFLTSNNTARIEIANEHTVMIAVVELRNVTYKRKGT